MTVELAGFPVIPGQEPLAQEWMQFLRNNQDAVLETLPGEHIHTESIFSLTLHQRLYLCWYDDQQPGGQPVTTSNHWLDQRHVAYWNACIDDSQPVLHFTLENHFNLK